MKPVFPDNKKFAFSIFDDTDGSTLENIRPVYYLLLELGLFTTKSVWVAPSPGYEGPYAGSATLEDPEYLNYIKFLAGKGFEIAFHNASMCSSTRENTSGALDRFKDALGFYPRSHANHHENSENLYWGSERLHSRALRFLMKISGKGRRYEGHVSGSRYFWGDLSRKHFDYVRNLVFREINLLKINPTIPYSDPGKPYVKNWFSSSEGATVESFNRLLSSKNQDRLEREGGVCIIYTHFAEGFTEKGTVNIKTKSLLSELSKRDGWFVPVSTLLDYLKTNRKREMPTNTEMSRMEFKWFLSKIFHGTS